MFGNHVSWIVLEQNPVLRHVSLHAVTPATNCRPEAESPLSGDGSTGRRDLGGMLGARKDGRVKRSEQGEKLVCSEVVENMFQIYCTLLCVWCTVYVCSIVCKRYDLWFVVACYSSSTGVCVCAYTYLDCPKLARLFGRVIRYMVETGWIVYRDLATKERPSYNGTEFNKRNLSELQNNMLHPDQNRISTWIMDIGSISVFGFLKFTT